MLSDLPAAVLGPYVKPIYDQAISTGERERFIVTECNVMVYFEWDAGPKVMNIMLSRKGQEVTVREVTTLLEVLDLRLWGLTRQVTRDLVWLILVCDRV